MNRRDFHKLSLAAVGGMFAGASRAAISEKRALRRKPDVLKPQSIEWALRHIEQFDDTDILPTPFEFHAIGKDWPNVRRFLTTTDLQKHMPGSPMRFSFPKPAGGFRVVHQLDPLDAIIYLAATSEAAEAIERHRAPVSERVACAYRIELTPGGKFFAPVNGWLDFHRRSRELTDCGKYRYVVRADIADFYNQIPWHGVATALSAAGLAHERAGAIEQFLMRLGGANQTRGIPVGSSSSRVLAEAVLSDIDALLAKKGYVHTRYMDDFRIFCETRNGAQRALRELGDALRVSRGLSLQPLKTEVLSIQEFRSAAHLGPREEKNDRERTRKLRTLIDRLREETGYGLVQEEVDSKADKLGLREHLKDALQDCLGRQPLHLGTAKYLLRQARLLRTRAILEPVFDNLEAAAPAFRDVARYLATVLRARTARQYGPRLIAFARTSPIGRLPYVRNWVLWLLAERPQLANREDAYSLAEDSRDALGIRPMALLMRAHQQADWVRTQKRTFLALPAWERRAVILACSALPSRERITTLRPVLDGDDPVDKAVARAVMA